MNRLRPEARRQLDVQLTPLRALPEGTFLRPGLGWIRALRDALGMSRRELAERMGVNESRIAPLEQAEAGDTVQLGTLRRAAAALDCQFVYAFVPNAALAQLVEDRARHVAATELRRVAHTMRLEDQETSNDALEDLIADRAAQLADRRGLWTDPHALRD